MQKVKEKFETKHIPVILLTAKTSDIDRIEGYEAGADGYICKPLNIPVLLAKIDNLLKKVGLTMVIPESNWFSRPNMWIIQVKMKNF